MKRYLLVTILMATNLFAQDTLKVAEPLKSNPIIFCDFDLGFGRANQAGWGIGASVNYQFYKNDLLTARIRIFDAYDAEYVPLGPILVLPIFEKDENIVDCGLLYGKRWIFGGTSISVSTGVSAIKYQYSQVVNETVFRKKEALLGIPFEVNLKFFKKVKRRYRAYYWLIPTGKEKVAFGRNFGLKLAGTISKANYFSIGFSFGLGTHKKY